MTAAYPRGPEETSGCHSAGAGRAVEGGAAVAGSLAWLTTRPHILNKHSKYVITWDTLYTSSATKFSLFRKNRNSEKGRRTPERSFSYGWLAVEEPECTKFKAQFGAELGK